jgi:hypothetical protein
MTLRVIVRTFDAGAAAHVNAPVETWFQTFDIEDVALEAHMRSNKPSLGGREIIGVELLPLSERKKDEGDE